MGNAVFVHGDHYGDADIPCTANWSKRRAHPQTCGNRKESWRNEAEAIKAELKFTTYYSICDPPFRYYLPSQGITLSAIKRVLGVARKKKSVGTYNGPIYCNSSAHMQSWWEEACVRVPWFPCALPRSEAVARGRGRCALGWKRDATMSPYFHRDACSPFLEFRRGNGKDI